MVFVVCIVNSDNHPSNIVIRQLGQGQEALTQWMTYSKSQIGRNVKDAEADITWKTSDTHEYLVSASIHLLTLLSIHALDVNREPQRAPIDTIICQENVNSQQPLAVRREKARTRECRLPPPRLCLPLTAKHSCRMARISEKVMRLDQ